LANGCEPRSAMLLVCAEEKQGSEEGTKKFEKIAAW